ncbi:MAG: (5-formylfuran-3-yl)methyl phosphate synthase [Planctomycetes bacterium]|nr:(5-formylfuran-3-yl)methyl phosphate synthase [Planctomycetota bacterium]
MTGLLVSVRDGDEACDALAGGASIIDVKEPSRGPLGRADAGVWRDVVRIVAGRVPVSVALGELRDDATWPEGVEVLSIHFSKVGLAGYDSIPGWRDRWRDTIRGLPDAVRPVAVSYADWRTAEAPSPREILETGREFGCAAWLIDTYDKSRGDLLSWVTMGELETWIADAKACGMTTVIAGALSANSIPPIARLAPDYIGVRGAVCRTGREGRLEADLVRQLRQSLDPRAPSPHGLADRLQPDAPL